MILANNRVLFLFIVRFLQRSIGLVGVFNKAKTSIHFHPREDVSVLGAVEGRHLSISWSGNEIDLLVQWAPMVSSLDRALTDVTLLQDSTVSVVVVYRVPDSIKDMDL